MNRRKILAGAGLGLSTVFIGCLGIGRSTDPEETNSPTATPLVEDPHGFSYEEDLRITNETGDLLEVVVSVSDSESGEQIESDTYEVPESENAVTVEFSLPRRVHSYTLAVQEGAEITEPYTPSKLSYLNFVIHSRNDIDVHMRSRTGDIPT